MATNTNRVEKEFAFGLNEYEGCLCPAMQAGYDPTKPSGDKHLDGLGDVTGKYDRIASKAIDGRKWEEGTISENLAESFWMKAIENLQEGRPEGHPAIEAAETVARELGWMEDSE